MLKITVIRNGISLFEACGDEEVNTLFEGEYFPGDELVFESDSPYIRVTADSSIAEARLFVPGGKFTFVLPLDGDSPAPYPPYAFRGEKHLLSLRRDPDNNYRNLALNPLDTRYESGAYPHITANVETRNESVFAARNVIDGLHTAAGHGKWPYGSWGIGAREDAVITLHFGTKVRTDKMVLYLRADFPHDAWWESGTVVMSNGYTENINLKQFDGPQSFCFASPQDIEWIKLCSLKKCPMPSAFPSLRQLEVYGTML